MNKENLAKLRDFLLENKDIIDFDMWQFSDVNYNKNYTFCGTAACAVGWASSIIPPDKELAAIWCVMPNQLTILNYINYCNTYLTYWFTSEAEFMFSGDWDRYDNTAEGAAFRIDLVLKGLEYTRLLETVVYGDDDKSLVENYNQAKAKWLGERNESTS